jgi:hypothetical protein
VTGIAALPTGTSSRARLPDRTGADAGLRGCSAERNRHFPSSASLPSGLLCCKLRGLGAWLIGGLPASSLLAALLVVYSAQKPTPF